MAKSSTSCSFESSSNFSNLPVMILRNKIVEKIMENRVTLIVGETGCGKSSQIPQFLLEENIEPILCTQPRRFAVMAVARMVAKSRNCEIGGEVGCHIGHKKIISERSKIVFKTAGVVLDEMREKGVKALNYKAIILDEVHERSVESDLVLVCVKQFMMKNNNLRVVLMSATADIGRYKDYLNDLGRGERVEVIAIPSSSQHTIFQRKVSYLEEVVKLLGVTEETESLSKKYCSGPTPSMSDSDIKKEVHKLIHDLVLFIHDTEADIEKSILIFLPTYYSLEQQWNLLRPFSSSFEVHILHSSIDTEQALMAMKISTSHRKVILATNIAESSVTIPKVAYVIDSCRSLQVFWDAARKKDSAELVWVSKSQAEQRRGRTGRTCDGQVYRLVTGSFFSQFQDFECPAIQQLSLRLQVLLLCCAESKAINDPRVLLHKALDPPDPEIVEDALSLLVNTHALTRTLIRGRYDPTFYGRMIASFSLSFDASVLILKFGNIGMLREGILLGILKDTQPLPILRPFGQEILHTEYTDSYFSGDNKILTGQTELKLMANLSAVQFWQRVFMDKYRLEHLKQLLSFGETEIIGSIVPNIEEEWCSFHNLVQSSMHHISEIYEDILNSIHRFRPKFLVKSNGLPSYFYPYEFYHTCLFNHQPSSDSDVIATDDKISEPVSGMMKCQAAPFVPFRHFLNDRVAENLATIVKEIKVQDAERRDGYLHYNANAKDFYAVNEPIMCRFFAKGLCNRGNQCMYSHSLQAERLACKFFPTLQGCRNGENCIFSHAIDPSGSSFVSEQNVCSPENEVADATSFLRLLPTSTSGFILILDDVNLHFSCNLSHYCKESKIISTTSLEDTMIFDPSLESVRVLWSLNHPYSTIISKSKIPWSEVSCIVWFPNLESYGELLEHKHLIKKFFEYLAIRMIGDALYGIQVIVSMNNLRFSQLQVEKLGRESFFFLTESFPYDESSFGILPGMVVTKKPMVSSRAISYVFHLQAPADVQFGDYASLLHKYLHKSQLEN